jgi:branched-chain amino acid transport system permease protein
MVLERLLYSRLYSAGELEQVLFTIGLIFVAVAVARLAYGTLPLAAPLPEWMKGQVELAGRSFPTYRVVVIAASAVLIMVLWIGLERTRWGAMVRAAVDNRAMAQSIGINTGRLFTLTFALGSGLAALGGALGADLIAMTPTYPFEQLVYFLIVVAVGGLGTLRGPFLGAVLIGVGDTACKYWVPQFGAFFIFVATIVLLLWRPQGLLGRAS